MDGVHPIEAVHPLKEIPPIESGFDGRARERIDATSGPWQYLVLFLFAATPLLEILVVIPIGIALGLDPVLVAVVAFTGNVLPIYGIVVGYGRLSTRLAKRRDDAGESNRRVRARRLWNRYGLPGVALLAPVATGVHLATIVALGLGARRRATAAWMTASVAAWTVAITIASVAGIGLVESVV